MPRSTSQVATRRSLTAAVAAFNSACSDLSIAFKSDGSLEVFSDATPTDYEAGIVRVFEASTACLTLRAFTIWRLWTKRVVHTYGSGRALLRKIFPDSWDKKEWQVYEWVRICPLIPLDDIDYTKPWEYYRRKYGGVKSRRVDNLKIVRAWSQGDECHILVMVNSVERVIKFPWETLIAEEGGE